MTATTEPQPRIVTMDVVRGFAVMGILAMNIVAFAMPPSAYVNPFAYGASGTADLAAYAFNFVLFDGKMRGLFALLFGASMLLVIRLAEAKGENPAAVTYRRLLWLLVFGILHFYFIWYGDILIGYALVGMVAYAFRDLAPRKLVGIGIALVAIQLVVMIGLSFEARRLAADLASLNPDPATAAGWQMLAETTAVPTPERLREIFGLYLGPWSGVVEHQLSEERFTPLIVIAIFGWETLSYMLFGMAALKSGFITGQWDDARYQRIAALGFAVTIPALLLIAVMLFKSGFTVPAIYAYAYAAPVPLRPLMVIAFAAWMILLTRNFGWLDRRIAAAGRAAFSNYIGTSLVMTGLFYGWGLGLFGSIGRAQLWLVVIAMWVVILAWSKPWLDRFTYGPFEWLWRSLSRWELQPMRRRLPASAVTAEA